MEYQVIQTAPDTWRIEDGGVRLFLLAGTEKALLIDSGMNLRNARDIAESLTQLPGSLLNTHADRDHIGSNGQFPSFYLHPAEEPFYRSSGGKGTVMFPICSVMPFFTTESCHSPQSGRNESRSICGRG